MQEIDTVRYFQSLADVAEALAEAVPNEPYAALVKKRNAVAAYGLAGGASAYAATSRRRLTIEPVPLREASTYAKAFTSDFRPIDDGGDQYVLRPPTTIGENNAVPLQGRARAIFLARFDGASIASRSYVIRTNGVAIWDFEHDERAFDDCPELDASIFAIDCDRAMLINDTDAEVLHVEEAFVSLLGPHSSAFGHWVWHQLPRLMYAIQCGNLKDMPVLIEQGMPPSHREALELIIPRTIASRLVFAHAISDAVHACTQPQMGLGNDWALT